MSASLEAIKRPRPVWLGLVVLGMGAVWLNGARSIAATTNYVGVGPAAMVIAVGIGLVVLGFLLTVQAWRGELVPEQDRPVSRRPLFLELAVAAISIVVVRIAIRSLGLPPELMVAATAGIAAVGFVFALRRGTASERAFLLAFAGVALPLATIQWLGFPLTAMASFTLVTHAFGSRKTLLDLCIGFALSSAAWWGFSHLGISLGGFLPLIG